MARFRNYGPAILALGLIASCRGDEDYLRKAREAYASHDYASARNLAAKALKADPENPEPGLIEVRSLLAMGDGVAGGRAVARMVEHGGTSDELAELGGLAAILRREPDMALAQLKQAGSAEAERLRSVGWLQKQDIPKAVAHLDKAIAKGGSAQIYADYATLELIRGNLDSANGMAVKALQADPNLLASQLVSGEVARMLGKPDKALGHFRKAKSLYPGDLAAMMGEAHSLGDLGRIAELKTALDPLSTRIPDDPEVRSLLERVEAARINQPADAGIPRS